MSLFLHIRGDPLTIKDVEDIFQQYLPVANIYEIHSKDGHDFVITFFYVKHAADSYIKFHDYIHNKKSYFKLTGDFSTMMALLKLYNNITKPVITTKYNHPKRQGKLMFTLKQTAVSKL